MTDNVFRSARLLLALCLSLAAVVSNAQDESTQPMFADMPDHPYKKERKDFLKRLGRS